MANESEYDDIRDTEDLSFLHRFLKEALEVAHHIRMARNLPDDIQQAAANIELEAQRSIRFLNFVGSVEELKSKSRTERSQPGLTKGVIKFSKAVRKVGKEPKYQSAEFKCIGDFDKCKKHRGKNSVLCHLAFLSAWVRGLFPSFGKNNRDISSADRPVLGSNEQIFGANKQRPQIVGAGTMKGLAHSTAFN
jgi:hypothetical protein